MRLTGGKIFILCPLVIATFATVGCVRFGGAPPPPPDARPDARSDTIGIDGTPSTDLKPPPSDQSASDVPTTTDIDTTATSISPLIAASSGGYGVVWVDKTSGTPALMFKMLDGTGAPLTGAMPIPSNPVQALTSMIWNGNDFVVIFSDSSGLKRARITESGAQAIVIKQFTTVGISWAQVVQAGTGYGLAYATDNQVLLQKLDINANKLGAPQVVHTAPATGFSKIGSYRSPMLAHGDGYFGIAFALGSASAPAAQGPLYFARLTTAGALVGPAQQIAAAPSLYPSVGHGAGHFTVTWHASGGPALLRIDAATGAVASTATLLGGDSCCDHAPMVDAGSAGLVEVWTASTGGNGVGIVRVDPASGAKLFGPQVVLPRPGLHHPWIAPRSGAYGLVWADTSLGGPQVFFSRIDASATPLGAVLHLSQ